MSKSRSPPSNTTRVGDGSPVNESPRPSIELSRFSGDDYDGRASWHTKDSSTLAGAFGEERRAGSAPRVPSVITPLGRRHAWGSQVSFANIPGFGDLWQWATGQGKDTEQHIAVLAEVNIALRVRIRQLAWVPVSPHFAQLLADSPLAGDTLLLKVLSFWFGHRYDGDSVSAEQQGMWSDTTLITCLEVACLFEDHLEEVCLGMYDSWAGTALGVLALAIILGQLPRKIYRNTAQAYAYDALALRYVRGAIREGKLEELGQHELVWLLAVLSDSEDLEAHNLRVRLQEERREQLSVEGAAISDRYAVRRDVIRRFGRFPWRNGVLGRAHTANEVEFLTELRSSAGQRPSVSCRSTSTANASGANSGANRRSLRSSGPGEARRPSTHLLEDGRNSLRSILPVPRDMVTEVSQNRAVSAVLDTYEPWRDSVFSHSSGFSHHEGLDCAKRWSNDSTHAGGDSCGTDDLETDKRWLALNAMSPRHCRSREGSSPSSRRRRGLLRSAGSLMQQKLTSLRGSSEAQDVASRIAPPQRQFAHATRPQQSPWLQPLSRCSGGILAAVSRARPGAPAVQSFPQDSRCSFEFKSGPGASTAPWCVADSDARYTSAPCPNSHVKMGRAVAPCDMMRIDLSLMSGMDHS